MSVKVQPNGNEELIHEIKESIASSSHQSISFYQFMGLCLYHPVYGYYSNEQLKIGKKGDFYTSSFIGSIMGEMLARSFVQMIQEQSMEQGTIHIVEWGGGNGQLARHLLDELRDVFPEVYKRVLFTSVESSQYHRQLQQKNLLDHKKCIQWLLTEEWFQQGNQSQTIIYSNELLDAFPVHRIQYHNSEYCEVYVSWDDKLQQFQERLIPLTEGPLVDYIKEEEIHLVEGQKAEINLEAVQWIKRLGQWIESGTLVTIDYGDVSQEIYAAHRMNGTLMCYRKHQAYDNPYIYIGEQDITSHVNFSACIRSGVESGFKKWSLSDQKTFLIEAGIMEQLQDHHHLLLDPFHPLVKKNRAIRQILLGDQMSELFKVLVQHK